MLSLAGIIGTDVRAADGRSVGRVVDMRARLSEPAAALVTGLLVSAGRSRVQLVPWSSVESFEQAGVLLRPGLGGVASAGTGRRVVGVGELLLVRDVLDTQIVDVAGHRLARVADVVLTRTARGELEVVAVEVGFGAVLRRLGLGWFARRAGEDAVAWSDLHLTSARGHSVQLDVPVAALHRLDAAGLAALVTRLDTAAALDVLGAAGPARAAAAVEASRTEVGDRLLRALPEDQASSVVAAMGDEPRRRWRARLAEPRALRGRHLLRSPVLGRRLRSPAAPSGRRTRR